MLKEGIIMNPIAFTLFNFEVRWYSLFILIGATLAYFLINIEAKRFNIKKDFIFNMFFWGLILGIIGARLYYVLFNWGYFSKHLDEIWAIWQGGLAIHGGIIVGVIVVWIYCSKHKFRPLRFIDMAVPGVILAQAIGRWGNFANAEAYGAATTLSHLKSIGIIPQFVIDGMYIEGTYYTPTFYYESLWCILGFIVIMILRRRKHAKVGDATAIYLIWYSVGRFFIEASRTDSLMFLNFKVAQIVSVILIIIGIIVLILNFRKGKYEDLYNDINNVEKVI